MRHAAAPHPAEQGQRRAAEPGGVVSLEHDVVEDGRWFGNLVEGAVGDREVSASEGGGSDPGGEEGVSVEAMGDDSGLDLEEVMGGSTCRQEGGEGAFDKAAGR